MKRCVYCAEELDDDAKFCTACGKRQTAAAPAAAPGSAAGDTPPPAAAVPAPTAAAARERRGAKPFKDKVREIYEKLKEASENDGGCDDRDCGCSNCYQFAMKVAAGKEEVTACPFAAPGESATGDEDDEKEVITCPVCGSRKFHLETEKFRKGMLLLGVVGAAIEGLRDKKTYYVCDKCGHKWE